MKLSIFCIWLSMVAVLSADTVYRVGTTFLTTADLDGDGRRDMVLVDGSNGVVRTGYQQSETNIVWSTPRALGLSGLTDIATGDICSTTGAELAVCSPLLNRLVTFDLSSASTHPVPMAGYLQTIGPEHMTALEIAGGGYDDMLVVSSMNGTSPYRSERLQSQGTNMLSLGQSTIFTAWQHLNPVEYDSGSNGVAVIDAFGSTFLRIYDPDSSGLRHIGSTMLSGLSTPAFVSFLSADTGNAEFVLWEYGSTTLSTLSWNGSVFSSRVLYELGNPIAIVQIFYNGTTPQLAVSFSNSQAPILYDYTGTGSPTAVQQFSLPATETAIGFLALGTNAIISISSESGTITDGLTANQWTASGGGFVPAGTQSLPAFEVPQHRANVMTFEGEPFVDPTPNRRQVLQAGDWVTLTMLTTNVLVLADHDRGIQQGLGDTTAYDLGPKAPTAAYALYSQINDAVSMYSPDEAKGSEIASISISPDPGVYGRSITIAFSVTPAADLYYRLNADDDWILYNDAFALFADSDIQYFATTTNAQTIVRTASYHFNQSPDALDSDGDGVPDYVELAYGMDPLDSGLDADGDGYSDRDELLGGSNPTNSVDIPASSNRFEQGAVYDHRVYLRPYDGVADTFDYAYEGTQVRLYAPEGAQYGYEKYALGQHSVLFDGVPMAIDPPFVALVSEPRFNVYDVATQGTNNQLGVEVFGVELMPTSTETDIGYDYQYGDLNDEAANWVDAALAVYTNQVREQKTTYLSGYDVLAGLLIERKCADLLYTRGTITNDWISLFPGRTADATMDHFTVADLNSLQAEGPGGEEAYLITNIVTQLINAPQTELRALTLDLYDICSDLGRSTNYSGQFPLPGDVLRQFLYTGDLQSNYLATTTLSPQQLTDAYTEATQALTQVTARTSASYSLSVRTNTFDQGCPVLYTTGGSAKSLYAANGLPYRFPLSFSLQTGAVVNVEAYTDVYWNDCPGTDPLEVISASLTVLPLTSSIDQNGNLIPDDYEAIFLAGGGNASTFDYDGDGYSDLQEYLDETEPDNVSSHSGSSPVDLSPPAMTLTMIDSTSATLAIDWPATYADPFVFVIQYTDDLRSTFLMEQELPQGNLSATVNPDITDKRFYRVTCRLR